MSVPKYTTPTFTLTFTDDNLDLTEAENVYVTFRSKNVLTKTGDDLAVTAKTISVYLTQEETGRFDTGAVQIQANWTMAGGARAASTVACYDISDQLLRGVIT